MFRYTVCTALMFLCSVTIISRLALIASDALVLLVTWWQLRGAIKVPGGRGVPSALVTLLLRDSEHDLRHRFALAY